MMLDLRPATGELVRVLVGLRHEQLDAPTPCAGMSVRALLHHADGFATAFRLAAGKVVRESPVADSALLDPFWRVSLPKRLTALADAWDDSAAWTGSTSAAGVELPAEAAGLFAVDEVVVHAWDLAAATGQQVAFDEALLARLHEFLRGVVAQHPEGSPGLFAAPVPVAAGAPLLHRVLGLTGRDPDWRPPVAADATG
jgi:uncharacterized protein (TIGR03086 family)